MNRKPLVSFKRVVLGGALLLGSGAPLFAQQAVTPEHPATVEQVREYLAITSSDVNARRYLAQMLSGIRASANPSIPAAVWDEMDAEFKKQDVMAVMVPAYQKYLSQEDMAGILAFYHSPAGQHMLQNQGAISTQALGALRELGEDVGQKAVAAHTEKPAGGGPAGTAGTRP